MILVLEDDERMVASMQRVFSGWGWDEKVLFDSPATVTEAVIALASIQPDIVCLDMNFTDDNLEEGVKVARWIDANAPTIVVLSISAHTVDYSRERYAGIQCVRHYPRKNPFEVRKCIEGTCACQCESKAV